MGGPSGSDEVVDEGGGAEGVWKTVAGGSGARGAPIGRASMRDCAVIGPPGGMLTVVVATR